MIAALMSFVLCVLCAVQIGNAIYYFKDGKYISFAVNVVLTFWQLLLLIKIVLFV